MPQNGQLTSNAIYGVVFMALYLWRCIYGVDQMHIYSATALAKTLIANYHPIFID